MTLRIGDIAPDFTAETTHGQPLALYACGEAALASVALLPGWTHDFLTSMV